MANLETLELTINGSATSASQGIDKLITSLSALSEAIIKPYSDLVDFNNELKKMRDLSKSINLPNIAKASAKAASAKARKSVKQNDYDPLTNNNRVAVNKAGPNAKPEDVWKAEYEANHKRLAQEAADRRAKTAEYRERIKAEANAAKEQAKIEQQAKLDAIKAERQAMDVRGQETQVIMDQSTKLDLLRLKQDALKMETISLAKEGKLTAKQIAERSIQYQKLGSDIQKLTAQMNSTKESTKGLEEQTKTTAVSMKTHINGVRKSAGGLLSTIGRIFKTMMIRTAIRALLKAAKEGLDNYYQYSKKMGGTFASSMDKITSKWNQIKNQLGAGIGTALSSLLPVLNAIGKAALFVLNTITALFALIGGKTTYTQAVEGMDEYAESAQGASSAAKDWLASFDELNVMTNASGGGSGNSSTGFGDLFKEVELPAWMVEWKPIIEAVLAGTLGAIILPKIWDWIQKIFGLFSGDVAEKAIDFVTDLLDDNNTLPDISGQAADMAVFGAGAAAAAAALPTVTKEIEAIVAALDGVSLLESLVGLIGELLTKVFAAIPVPFELDTEEYDKFKEEHEEWIKVVDSKVVNVEINDDVEKITQLTLWSGTEETKTINVVIDDDVAKITQLTLWAGTEETKSIKVDIADDVAKITQLTLWVGTEETKTINVDINDDVEKITQLTLWVGTEDTKTINVDINDDVAKITQLSLWIGTDETKTINVEINDDVAKITQLMLWAGEDETKKIKVEINDDVAKITQLTLWTGTTDTKEIEIKFKGVEGILTIDDWINEPGAKQINIDVKGDILTLIVNTLIDAWDKLDSIYNTFNLIVTSLAKTIDIYFDPDDYNIFVEQVRIIDEWINTVGKKIIAIKLENDPTVDNPTSGSENGNDSGGDSGTSIWDMNTNQLVNKYLGWDWPEEGWIPYLVNQVVELITGDGGDTESVEIDVNDLVDFTGFADMTATQRQNFVTAIFDAYGSKAAIDELKKKIPDISVGGIISMTNWKKFSEDQQLEFVTALKDAFGAKEAQEAAEAAGIDVGKLVKKGMESENPNIKKQAESWNGLITKEVDDKTHKTTAKLDYDEKTEKSTADKLAALVTGQKPQMASSLTYTEKTEIETRDKLAGLVTGIIPKMTSELSYDTKTNEITRDNLKKLVTDTTASMTSSLTYDTKTNETTRDNLKKLVTDTTATMTSSLSYDQITNETTRDNLKGLVTGVAATMTSSLSYDTKTNETTRDNLKKLVTDTTADMKSKLSYDDKEATATKDSMVKIITDANPQLKATTFIDQGKKEDTGSLTWLVDFVNSYSGTLTAKSFIDQGTANEAGSLTWFIVEALGNANPILKTWAFIDQGTESQDGSMTWFLALLAALHPEIAAKAAFNSDQAKGALNAALSGILVTIAVAGIAYTIGSLKFKANGGFVDSGDIFVANENGVPEMVGSFGHQTAVANNDQIVAGIASGVEAANAEQNALLRQQNALLRGILEKDSSVRIGASAELGRVTRQSLNMYSGLVGG